MQNSGELCDVRAIMAASSPFFRGMFTSDLAETSQENIFLKEVDYDNLLLHQPTMMKAFYLKIKYEASCQQLICFKCRASLMLVASPRSTD